MQTTPPGGASSKRPASGTLQADTTGSKKARYSNDVGLLLGPADLTPQQLEASLTLPVDTDEARIAETAVETNRAPLVLAFVVELIRHTMPEQPPSSRLSLAQAVVSANSRSKAVSLGLEKGASADEEGWGEGQPRIRVMGREVSVLKRSGYEWKEDEEKERDDSAGRKDESIDEAASSAGPAEEAKATTALSSSLTAKTTTTTNSAPNLSTSSSITLKKSTFIARAVTITDSSQRPTLLKSLLDTIPSLRTASHNVWAYRIHPSESSFGTQIREASHDDGETGGGDLLLRVMRESNVVDTLVVMTRWYGGVMLGPDRWRLMRNVVTGALTERLRVTGAEARLGEEAVWGLDLEAMRTKTTNPSGYNKATAAAAASSSSSSMLGGLVIHRPEAARNYLLRSFASASATATISPDSGNVASSSRTSTATTSTTTIPTKKKSAKEQNTEKEQNLALLLGALRHLFDSWADRLTPEELDRRAWGWYMAVRPAVDSGPSGWGAKGVLRLKDILTLKRKTA